MLQQNGPPEQESPLEFDSGRGQCPNCACLTLQHRCPECGYLIRPPNSRAVVLNHTYVPPYDEGQQGLAVLGEVETRSSAAAEPRRA
jgi:hypothetical protein